MNRRTTMARLIEAGRNYFSANPDDDLDAHSFAIKFDCSEEAARKALLKLKAEGREQAIIAPRSTAFPASLSAGELLAVKALAATGTHADAATLLGVAVSTVRSQLNNACKKAGVSNKVRLMVVYLRARLGVQP